MNVETLVAAAPIVPVVVIHDAAQAVPMARALVEGGLPVIEVTMRTPAALEAIRRIAAEVPDAIIGAGTLTRAEHVDAAIKAGSRFLVSPGITPSLLDAMVECGLPILPGTSDPSSVMQVLERGLTHMKFFPAEPAGGLTYLKAVAGPFPEVRFCPTGGIDVNKAKEYLAQPNIPCVGGTWVTPADALKDGDWARIADLARTGAALRR